MKKVLAIACLLVLSLSAAAMAADTNWAIYLEACDGANANKGVKMQIGVKPTALDGLDVSDGAEAALSISMPTNKWATGRIPVETGSIVYSKDYMSTALPTSYVGNEKIWELRVAGLSQADTTTPIRLRFSTTNTTLLPATGWLYKVRMVDNKDVAGAPANNTEWLIPSIPTTAATVFQTISLPTVTISASSSAAMINEGYAMEFIQYPIPEPGSLLVLGTGLAGIVGFVSRRRRA